jgi:hypothetical protein
MMNNLETIVANHLKKNGTPPDEEELRKIIGAAHLTVGFTIQNIRPLLDAYKTYRDNTPAGTEIIGWVFKYPTTPAKLVSGIEIFRLEIEVTATGSKLMETRISYPDDPRFVIIPKVLFQQRIAQQPSPATTYGPAYNETLPQVAPNDDLSLRDMEDHYDWAELALLQRFDLDNLADYLIGGPQGYNDIFFSGANLDFATMHHPVMRLEQFALDGGSIPIAEARRPFTLKAEPYIADANLDWLPFSGAASRGSRSISADPSPSTTGLPAAPFLYPCPTAWDYGTLVTFSAAQRLGIRNVDLVARLQKSITSFYTGGAQALEDGPLQIDDLTTADLPQKDTPTPEPTPETKPGCLSFLGLFIFLVTIFLFL